MPWKSIAANGWEKLQRKAFDLEDWIFERRHRLELGGLVPKESLVSNDRAVLPHATAYQAVWTRNLRELFAETEKTGIPLRHFVDLGSGKGKACFYAATRLDFTTITGVEFSPPLVDIAMRNQVRFNRRHIGFTLGDAQTFPLPDGNTLVFMFNPFDATILDAFLENNLRHFRQFKSLIAYANDTQRTSLRSYGFETIFRNQTRRISLHQLA